jgi:Fe-S-cluster containining protein
MTASAKLHPANALPTENPDISCATCRACCCKLEVLLMGGDDEVPERLTKQDQWGGWVMRRLDDGWCVALDRATMLCTIYAQRPGVCRDYEVGDSDCLIEFTAR